MNDSNRRSFGCALITGASSGLGEEYARQLAGGAGGTRAQHLVLVARREEKLQNLAGQLRKEGVEVTVIAADLTKPAERERLVQELAAADLQPDLLVNNAGLGDYGEFQSAEWEKLRAMLQVNIEALTHLTFALLPGLKTQKGAVVNVSSLASTLPIPDFAVYAATKAYVSSFSEALRIELKEHGVTVLAVCPGPVHTGFGEVAMRDGRTAIPSAKAFYVKKQQVVAETWSALQKQRARLYPGAKVAIAAALIGALPLVAVRVAMGFRPRRDG